MNTGNQKGDAMKDQGAFDASLKVGDMVEARWRSHGTFHRCEAVIELLGDSTMLVLLTDPDKRYTDRPRVALPRAHNGLWYEHWGAFPVS